MNTTKAFTALNGLANDYAAFRSNDRTNPPTYDFTSIWFIVSVETSSGSSLNGGKLANIVIARMETSWSKNHR